MFFKDLTTEITEDLKRMVNPKNFRKCPVCKKGRLKRTNPLQHYVEVASSKIASAIIGGPVPAPDYRFTCPRCGAVCLYINGVYVPLPGIKR